MSTNYIQEGDVIEFANSGAAIASGDVVAVGNQVGVAMVDIAATSGSGSVQMCGVFSLAKVGSQAWSQGDLVFWDKTNLRFTKTASSDADCAAGIAWEAVGSGAGETTGKVLLKPGFGRKAAIVAYSAGTNLVGVDGTGSNAAPLTGTETRLDAIDTAIAAIITALKNAGLMDS